MRIIVGGYGVFSEIKENRNRGSVAGLGKLLAKESRDSGHFSYFHAFKLTPFTMKLIQLQFLFKSSKKKKPGSLFDEIWPSPNVGAEGHLCTSIIRPPY